MTRCRKGIPGSPEIADWEVKYMKKILTVTFAISISIFAASLYAGNAAPSPEVITIDSLTDKYEPVFFTHARHISMAGGCGTCHHEHGNSGTLPCKECHSLAPSAFKNSVTRSFIACKGCHGAYSAANPKVPGLKVAYHSNCFQCHRGMGNVGIDPKGCTELCHARKEVKVSKK